ncbi:DUF4767 domain-containing protein [Vagococcus vulneris]|uniref:DUF4767 domain-containing protein n=1 Tax=Vagococcus vulneris TaxID=1977869 RepID=A0A430A279_9ENTE|nr:DUF4767 domain-containing protein [Vagococcus vulneris]RSU00546.1 hypothetical protein CBF37_00595 [Vagococcus vulneris]
MKFKNIYFLFFLFIFLAGCSHDKQTTKPSTDNSKMKISQSSSSSDKKGTTELNQQALWADKKQKELNNFMTGWGKEMQQTYKPLIKDESIKWYDKRISLNTLTEKNKVCINNQVVNMLPIASNVKKDSEVLLLTAYSDIDNGGQHLYIFTIKEQTPTVFITEQPENDQGQLNFIETKNKELSDGFKTVFNQDNTKNTFSNSSQSDTKKEVSKFKELSKQLQVLMAGQYADNRVNQYKGLSGMDFYYSFDGTDLYTYITSGVGTGHPLYHIEFFENGIKVIQGVVYQGAVSGFSTIETPNEIVSYSELYDKYINDKQSYDQALSKMKNTGNETKENYIDTCSSAGVQPL